MGCSHFRRRTEPMRNAEPGDILSFSSAQIPEKIQEIPMQPLSESKAKRGRQMVRGFAERRAKRLKLLQEQPSPIQDAVYSKAISMLDDGEPLNLDGVLDLTE
jgi:hypothetical protein